MPLSIACRKLTFIMLLPRYNLVVTIERTKNATDLRESIMALTRQLRRHRPDNGLTLSQMQLLGEISRSGVTTPAELAARMHVRVQSLTDGINELEARRLVSRRTDPDDRRRQLIETTVDGSTLLDADRADRDAWLDAAMRETLTDLEFDLLMLVAPVLRKLADGDERPREEHATPDERPREEHATPDEHVATDERTAQ
jgi:DNA-binding MarR family transcriptional regulator